MNPSYQRRKLLIAAAAMPLLVGLSPLLARAEADSLSQQLASLEREVNGRIGLALLDTHTGEKLTYRGDERFPLCSTFKLLAAAVILRRSEQQPDLLLQRMHWTPAEHLAYMPVTEKHQDEGMTLEALCLAALQYSDNLAGNLLLKTLGGPAGITDFARGLGDNVTRLDRNEPALNTAVPGDLRDTTSPLAMLGNLNTLLLGSGLAPSSQEKLASWLKGNTTGKKAITAAVPAGWIVGDKTGSGDYGTTNDVAILWRPDATPLLLAIYFTQQGKDARSRQDVLAKTARLALAALKA